MTSEDFEGYLVLVCMLLGDAEEEVEAIVPKEKQPFRILTKKEYNVIDNKGIMLTTYLDMAPQIVCALNIKGLDCTTMNIFTYLLSYSVIINISEHTTKQLVKSGFAHINPNEFKECIGTR